MGFGKPLDVIDGRVEIDWLMYEAPLDMVFYGTGPNDPADPYIPATLSVVAAESLGLGRRFSGVVRF